MDDSLASRDALIREMGKIVSGEEERTWDIVNNRLLKGAIDMHIHPIPDPEYEGRVSCLDAAVQAREAGMKAIVLKSHFYITSPIVATISHLVPGITLFGGYCLDYGTSGGLNTATVEMAAKLGTKVLWMPTLNALPMMRLFGEEGGIYILDAEGKVLPVVTQILEIAKSYNTVVCNGHLTFAESLAFFQEARRVGVTKLVATHALFGPDPHVWPPFSLDEVRQMAAMGVCIEHTSHVDVHTTAQAVRVLGAENCLMSTDAGQITNPPPAEQMRLFLTKMLRQGISARDLETMVKVNPSRLLDMD